MISPRCYYKNEKRKKLISILLISLQFHISQQHKLRAITKVVANAEIYRIINFRERKSGRYLRGGALPSPKESFWRRIDRIGDEMEFLHFLAFTRESFDDLVNILTPGIISSYQNIPLTNCIKRYLYRTQ